MIYPISVFEPITLYYMTYTIWYRTYPYNISYFRHWTSEQMIVVSLWLRLKLNRQLWSSLWHQLEKQSMVMNHSTYHQMMLNFQPGKILLCAASSGHSKPSNDLGWPHSIINHSVPRQGPRYTTYWSINTYSVLYWRICVIAKKKLVKNGLLFKKNHAHGRLKFTKSSRMLKRWMRIWKLSKNYAKKLRKNQSHQRKSMLAPFLLMMLIENLKTAGLYHQEWFISTHF